MEHWQQNKRERPGGIKFETPGNLAVCRELKRFPYYSARRVFGNHPNRGFLLANAQHGFYQDKIKTSKTESNSETGSFKFK